MFRSKNYCIIAVIASLVQKLAASAQLLREFHKSPELRASSSSNMPGAQPVEPPAGIRQDTLDWMSKILGDSKVRKVMHQRCLNMMEHTNVILFVTICAATLNLKASTPGSNLRSLYYNFIVSCLARNGRVHFCKQLALWSQGFTFWECLQKR